MSWTRPRRCWPARTGGEGCGERGEGAAERVTLTTDDATLPAAAGIAAILHAQGYAIERRAFVHSSAEGPRRVVLLALDRPLPALVALLVPETAPPAPRPSPGLVAALYPDAGGADGTPATLQLKGTGAFASVTARSGAEARGPDGAGAAGARAVVVAAAARRRRRAAHRVHRGQVVQRVGATPPFSRASARPCVTGARRPGMATQGRPAGREKHNASVTPPFTGPLQTIHVRMAHPVVLLTVMDM